MNIKNFKNDNLFVYANSDGEGFRYFKEEAVEKLITYAENLIKCNISMTKELNAIKVLPSSKERAISAWRELHYSGLIGEKESNKLKAKINKL